MNLESHIFIDDQQWQKLVHEGFAVSQSTGGVLQFGESGRLYYFGADRSIGFPVDSFQSGEGFMELIFDEMDGIAAVDVLSDPELYRVLSKEDMLPLEVSVDSAFSRVASSEDDSDYSSARGDEETQ